MRNPQTPAAAQIQLSVLTSKLFWRQVWILTLSNLKSRYRKTWAGFVWVVVNPLIMFGVQSLVFKKFLRLEVPNYALFLLSGLLPWIFIVQTLEMGTSLLQSSGRLLKSFPVHPMVFLLSQMLDNLINFLAAFLLLLIPIWLNQPSDAGGLLLLPVALFWLTLGVFGMTFLLATLQVFFRDTRFLLSFLIGISFFLTPVFYPVEFIPEGYRWLTSINPFYRLIHPFRVAIYDFDPLSFMTAIGASALAALAFLTASLLLWRSKRNEIYFHL